MVMLSFAAVRSPYRCPIFVLTSGSKSMNFFKNIEACSKSMLTGGGGPGGGGPCKTCLFFLPTGGAVGPTTGPDSDEEHIFNAGVGFSGPDFPITL